VKYKGTPGELIYEYTLRFTQVVAYGASADAVFSGQIPPQRRRGDSGKRVAGLAAPGERDVDNQSPTACAMGYCLSPDG